MTRKLVSLFLALIMLFSLTAFAAAEDTSITVTDMYGREITLSEPATRIVALTAADCEILCALGAEDVLVGRGEYCDYPESIQDLPVVASGAETNIEQILSLNPQVVLMADMAQSKDMVDQLESNGVKVVVSNADNIEGVYTAIRMIGTLMDKDAEAEALISDMQSTFDEIAAHNTNSGKTVYFEVSPLEWGLWTAGAHTFMDELASMCGLKNAFADVEGWAEISQEQVIERDPDYIVTITMYYGEGPTPEEEIKSRAGWENMKAIQNDHIFLANNDEISRPGPRLKDAAIALDQFVNGEATENEA